MIRPSFYFAVFGIVMLILPAVAEDPLKITQQLLDILLQLNKLGTSTESALQDLASHLESLKSQTG
jgi:hypothetical protein